VVVDDVHVVRLTEPSATQQSALQLLGNQVIPLLFAERRRRNHELRTSVPDLTDRIAITTLFSSWQEELSRVYGAAEELQTHETMPAVLYVSQTHAERRRA